MSLGKKNHADWAKFFAILLQNFGDINPPDTLDLQKELQNIVQECAYGFNMENDSYDECNDAATGYPKSPPNKKRRVGCSERQEKVARKQDFARFERGPDTVRNAPSIQQQYRLSAHHSQYVSQTPVVYSLPVASSMMSQQAMSLRSTPNSHQQFHNASAHVPRYDIKQQTQPWAAIDYTPKAQKFPPMSSAPLEHRYNSYMHPNNDVPQQNIHRQNHSFHLNQTAFARPPVQEQQLMYTQNQNDVPKNMSGITVRQPHNINSQYGQQLQEQGEVQFDPHVYPQQSNYYKQF